jgi:hypothetical protein
VTPKNATTSRRTVLHLLGSAALGVAVSATFGHGIRRAAAAAAGGDRRPQSPKPRPRWIGHS